MRYFTDPIKRLAGLYPIVVIYCNVCTVIVCGFKMDIHTYIHFELGILRHYMLYIHFTVDMTFLTKRYTRLKY